MIVQMLKEDHELLVSYLAETLTGLFQGEIRTNLVSLRNIVNASCGFPYLAKKTELHEKTLHRILSTGGNPTSENLFSIVRAIMAHQGLKVQGIDLSQAA